MEWYCVIRGQRLGPMTWEALQALAAAGRLTPEDLVWQSEYGETWRRGCTVPDLFSPTARAGAAAPSPQPEAERPPPLERVRPPQPVSDTELRASLFNATSPLHGVEGKPVNGLDVAGDAWRRMKRLLFSPFDLARWFSIGFCAWLALIGSGSYGNSRIDPDAFRSQIQSGESPLQALGEQARAFVQNHPAITAGVVTAVVAVVLVQLVLGIIFCWLRARGTFMLLHRMHRPEASIREAWQVAGGTSASLFWWRLGLGVGLFVSVAIVLAGAAFSLGIPILRSGSPELIAEVITPIWVAVWAALLLTVVSLILMLMSLTDHFVEPVMYWRQVGVWEAWRTVGDVCRHHAGSVAVFYLWLFVWYVLIGLALLGFVLVTCCLGCIVLILPYVGAVAMLPALLFKRGLGLSLLARWRPDLVPTGLDRAGG